MMSYFALGMDRWDYMTSPFGMYMYWREKILVILPYFIRCKV